MFRRLKTYDLFILVLLAFCIFLLLPVDFYYKPSKGLDPSYQIANHLAHQFHLVYGKDFVFTYGPLGILYSRLPIGVPLVVYLLFDLYLLATAFFVLKSIFKLHSGPAALLFILFVLIMNIGTSPDVWYIVFLIFYVLAFTREVKLSYIIQAAVLSLLCFYCKLNLGLMAILVFLAGIGYVVVRREITIRRFLLIVAGYVLFIVVSALALHVNLPGYFRGSLHLIDAYNDAMFSEQDYMVNYLRVALVLLAVFVGMAGYRILRVLFRRDWGSLPSSLLAGGVTLLLLFTLFKTSFVRADLSHVGQIFRGVLPLAGLLYLYCRPGVDRWVLGAGCWVILLLSITGMQQLSNNFFAWKRMADGAVLSDKVQMAARYFRELRQYPAALEASNRLYTADNPIKRIVGDAPVDVMTSEISTIYFNGLHYDPRPVVQSYSVYDGYLDSLNYRKYLSADAPEYILFNLTTIDGREPFFDEPRTKLALLARYRVAGKIGEDLLLRKKEGSLGLRMVGVSDTITGRINQDISLPDGMALHYWKVLLRYNARGKVWRLLYHPPRLRISITLADDEVKEFKAVKPILEDGVLLSRYIESTEDFQLLSLSKGRLSQRIKKIRIITDSSQNGFDSSVQLVGTLYTFVGRSHEEEVDDSMRIAALMASYASYCPQLADTGSFRSDVFALNIDQPQQQSRLLQIRGWAFRQGANNTRNEDRVVLNSNGAVYELTTKMEPRGDLNGAFNRRDLDSAGFLALADRTQLPPGNYRVGVLIRDPASGRQWIHYDPYQSVLISAGRVEKTDDAHLGAVSAHKLASFVEHIETKDDQLMLSGWAFVQKAGSRVIPTNVLLRSGTTVYRIPAAVTQRGDLAAFFKDSAALFSGWMIRLAQDSLPAGVYTIGIEKEDSYRHAIAFSDRTVTLNAADKYNPTRLSVLPQAASLPFHIELVRDSSEKTAVSGWVAAGRDTIRRGRVMVLLKSGDVSYAIDATTTTREDVTAAFGKTADLEGAGFDTDIEKTMLPPGSYRLGVAIYLKKDAGEVVWTDRVIEVQ